MSQRSGSLGYAGYSLFSSAAAAMGRLGGRQDNASLERSASKRAISHGDLAQMAVSKRGHMAEQSNQSRPPLPLQTHLQDEAHVVGGGDYFTSPESPIKDYKQSGRKRSASLTNQSRKAFGVLGQGAKRILTGTSSVSVQNKVESIEDKDRDGSPTKLSAGPATDMTEVSPRRVSSSGAAFWRHQQGAKDWADTSGDRSGTVRRRSGRPAQIDGQEGEASTSRDDHDEDWDPEIAVQQRVVQVMFTVPKEKLRVVNADNLSMISRTDTTASKDSYRSNDDRDTCRVEAEVGAGDENLLRGPEHLAITSLHPDSAKGKERIIGRYGSGASGGTVGKAL